MTDPAPGTFTARGLDSWGRGVAALVGGPQPGAVADLHILLIGDGPRAAARLAAVGTLSEASGNLHLPVVRASDGLWIGPTVMPGEPGCVSCWQARRRQHGPAALTRQHGPAALTREHAPAALTRQGADGPPADSRLAARAVLAVARRVLAEPESEAGVVRRLAPGRRVPQVGRVAPVAGCPRCDHGPIRTSHWSLSDGERR